MLYRDFEYRSDISLYGVTDKAAIRWVGDCEDFALLAQEELGMGTVMSTRTPSGQRHAVLMLPGGVLIDVRFDRPVMSDEAGYKTLWPKVFDEPVPDLRGAPIEAPFFFWGIYN